MPEKIIDGSNVNTKLLTFLFITINITFCNKYNILPVNYLTIMGIGRLVWQQHKIIPQSYYYQFGYGLVFFLSVAVRKFIPVHLLKELLT